MKSLMIILGLLMTLMLYPQQKEPLGWPRLLTTKSGQELTLYQPQLDQLKGNLIEGRMAISAKDDEGELVFGAIWLSARLATDQEAGIAAFEDINVDQTKFPEDIPEDKIDALKQFLVKEMTAWEPVISLSDLKASMAEIETAGGRVAGLNNEAPVIYYRESNAVLVMIDGEPQWKDDTRAKVSFVMNSPFFIAREKGKSLNYLRGGAFWYQSGEITSGWKEVDRVPKAILQFAEENAPKEDKDNTEVTDTAPAIIVSQVPAELVVVAGKPDYQQISSTNLLYVKNTENDIILDIDDQKHYLLLAGRFYASKSLADGTWEFVEPSKLPTDFAIIPDEESISSIKSSVPGTVESKEALLEQAIPQTAEVDRSKTIEVTFDGAPRFKEVTGTAVAYAENSAQTVLKIEGVYYCVDEGIWYSSQKAKGTYSISTERPDQVDDLPADCPVHHVKYVYIYETTPQVVYVGYTPGYYHSYIYGGVVVYGTGWYYRPWYGYYYYPRPVTYGFGVHWNPYTGWGFTVGISFGWIGWGFHPYYRPYWGPRGYYPGYRHGYYHGYHRGYAAGYRAGYRAAQRPSVYHNKKGVRTLNHQNYRSQIKTRPSTFDRTRPKTRPSTRPNNVLSDRKGNVYQRDNKGNWTNANGNRLGGHKYSGPTANQKQQLNRAYQNRQKMNRGTINRSGSMRRGRRG